MASLKLAWTAPTLPSGATLAGYDVHYTSAPETGDDAVADGAAVQTGQSPSPASGWVDAAHSGTAAEHEITGLDIGTAYRLRVRARNAAGDSAWLTGTGTPVPPDETPPSPEFDPADGQAVSDTGTNITLTFAEAVKKNSAGADFSGHADLANILTLAEDDGNGTAIPFAATIDADKKVITLNPSSDLAEGKVHVAISDLYYDTAGNQGTAGSATFTVDTTPPAAPKFSPVNGHKEQNPGTNITLTFAEAVKKDGAGADFTGHTDLASILTLAVDDETGTAIPFAASIGRARKVITLNPSRDLPAGTVYVAISADHWDAAGNQGAAASATFTVRPVKPTDLTVTAGDTKLDLSWTAPAGTVTGYDVHYTSAVAGTVADNASVQTGRSPSAADGWVDAGHSGTAASQSLTGPDRRQDLPGAGAGEERRRPQRVADGHACTAGGGHCAFGQRAGEQCPPVGHRWIFHENTDARAVFHDREHRRRIRHGERRAGPRARANAERGPTEADRRGAVVHHDRWQSESAGPAVDHPFECFRGQHRVRGTGGDHSRRERDVLRCLEEYQSGRDRLGGSRQRQRGYRRCRRLDHCGQTSCSSWTAVLA